MTGQYDKNCCGLTHRTSTICICTIGYILLLTAAIVLIARPSLYEKAFGLGMSKQNYIIVIAVVLVVFFIFHGFLAASLYYEGPALMMVWLIGNALGWNMYLILIIAISIITGTRKKNSEMYEGSGYVALRLILLTFLLVLWLIMIIKVGRHWFALCEEILQQLEEQERIAGLGGRSTSMKKRMRTMSMFSRYKRTDSEHGHHPGGHRAPSSHRRYAPSQRMPAFMQKFERNKSTSDHRPQQKWENRPRNIEIERGSNKTAASDRSKHTDDSRSMSSAPSSAPTERSDRGRKYH